LVVVRPGFERLITIESACPKLGEGGRKRLQQRIHPSPQQERFKRLKRKSQCKKNRGAKSKEFNTNSGGRGKRVMMPPGGKHCLDLRKKKGKLG